jgi:membrane protein
MAAYLPSLLAHTPQRPRVPGLAFELALEALQLLQAARATEARGLTLQQLAQRLRADPAQLDLVLATLRSLDWVGQLQEEADGTAARQVLLAEPALTPLVPLVERLLLQRADGTSNLWKNSRLALMTLDQAL